MKAVREVGIGRILRFLWVSCLLGILRWMWLPPLRALFLRACGATIGPQTVVQSIALVNVDRGGFRALRIGANCFIGTDVLFDLAAPIAIEDHVTIAARAMILTHLNVGYRDHPLQSRFPSHTGGVTIRRGSFVGAGATVLAGVSIGPEAFVAAASLVNRDVRQEETVGGVPVRTLSRAGADAMPQA
jgi:acetyltransferase-like isoleucine patch superfamily enzyme